MKKSKNALILLLVLVLVLSACLVACNKKGQNDEQKQRENQVGRVEQAFLSGVRENWSASLSDSEAAKLDDAGDYIVAKGWTSLVCDVIKRSSMQTQKIKMLADTLESKDGKKLLAEFSDNAELLVPMLKTIGLTSSDVSALAYDLISKLISDGKIAVSNIIARLDGVKDLLMASTSANPNALRNVSENRIVLDLARESLNATADDKKEMQSALANAKNALSELIRFAYDTSVNTLTDELYSKLFVENGALSDISDTEISTLVSALLGNVSSLKNTLTASEIAKLNTALNLFIENFDNKSISSAVYSQIIKYAKYAYMVVDVIPALCDVAAASESVISSKSFIDKFKTFTKLEGDGTLNSSTSNVNKLVLAANVIYGVMEQSDKFSKDSITELINRVCAQGSEGYQKAMPVIYLDLLLNVSDLVGSLDGDVLKPAHDCISQETLRIMFSSLAFNANVDGLKQAYYDFELNPNRTTLNNLYAKARSCAYKGILGSDCPKEQPGAEYDGSISDFSMTLIKSWYNWHIENIPTVSEKIASCIDSVQTDLNAFVNEYYQTDSKSRAAIKRVADWDLYEKDIEDEQLESIMQDLYDSRIFGAAILFMLWNA